MPDQPRRILIVEDEGIVAADIQGCLEDSGFEVTGIAASAEDALQEALTHRPDLVLMDIRIQGGMDGIETAELLYRRFGVPSVYLTAHGDKATIERAKKTHPLGFLLKPFKQAELNNAVEFALENARLEREERERQRAALQESEQRFRLLLEMIPQLVWTARPDGQCDYLSPQWVEYTGIAEDDELGPGWLERLHPEDREPALHTWRQCSETQMPYDVEFRIQARYGGFRWCKIRALPLVGADGHIAKWFGTCTDIEDLRKAEQEILQLNAELQRRIAELRQSEQRERTRAAELEAIMDAVPAAIVISRDPECATVLGNRAAYEMMGRPRGSNLAKAPGEPAGFAILRDGTEVSREDFPLNAAARTGRPVEDCELEVVLEDGTRRHVFGTAVPLLDESGRACGAAGAFLDITERNRMEERLREAQKAESIGVLAGGIAHDFNNLLTSILGNASLMLTESPPGNGHRLKAIIESSERAAALTRQLLAYAGKGQFQITDFDVAAVLRSSAGLLSVSIPKDIEVRLDVPRHLPVVRGDASQIQQVAMNLILNAAEAIDSRKHGSISVCARVQDLAADAAGGIGGGLAPGRYIAITFRDDGCGMDEDTQSKIFDPFFTTKFMGRGLGLAAVKGILKSHRGAITVESQPERGSTFTVYLPTSGPAWAGPVCTDAPESAHEGAVVLVVDDEEPIQVLTKLALERMGHTVLLALNGREALSLLAAHKVDLVLLDIVMPVAGGAEAFAEMRTRWPHLPVLIASGYSRQEARRLGIPEDIPFIEKPYTVQRLAVAVEKALAVQFRGQAT